MQKNRLVSIIILNHNGKHHITDCIDSVIHSSHSNFEIIVVDNASSDSSYTFLLKRYRKNKKVIVIHSEKQLYFTGGCNFGAKKARGKKLFFLNSDTVIDKNCLRELVKFTSKNSNYIVQPKILQYNQPNLIDNAGGKYSFWGFGYGIGKGDKDQKKYNKKRQIDFVNGTAFFIDRAFFKKLGGFDEKFKYFYEDVDLCLRAKKDGGKCWYCSNGVVYHKGSLTFKQNPLEYKISSHIRRNRFLTLWKNQRNLSLIIKIPIMILITIYLFLKDQIDVYLANHLK